MKLNTNITMLGLAAVMTMAAMTPTLADDASRQKNKNTWRNVGIAGAAVAGYGLLKHNSTATVVGAAAGAYGAKRYEDERHSQDTRKRARQRYHRTHRYYNASTHRYYYR